VRISAEATPHHFALTEESLGTYDTQLQDEPPLRTEADRLALIAGLEDGTLDIIATDHAPHTNPKRIPGVRPRPNGILGVGNRARGSFWKSSCARTASNWPGR
jgi:dihydroorotase